MIIYTVTGKVGQAGYLDIANSGDISGKNIYVNMTNRCPCSCVFCLRQTKKMREGNTLWLKGGEPSGQKNIITTAGCIRRQMFEHREDADHHELTLTLRSLLFAVREGVV